jgi:hypothetical protein
MAAGGATAGWRPQDSTHGIGLRPISCLRHLHIGWVLHNWFYGRQRRFYAMDKAHTNFLGRHDYIVYNDAI